MRCHPFVQVQVNVARLVLSSHCTHTDEMLARGKCGVDTYKKYEKKEIKNHFRNDSINSIVAAVSSVINANNGNGDGHETRFLFLALMFTSELLDIDTF